MTPFSPRHVKDLTVEVPEAPAWLVHGLLPRGTLALLAAYPKVGKSTLATQWAVAVAQGRDFLGRRTQQGGVLLIVAEERKDDVMRRLRHFGMNGDDPVWLWTETVTDTQEDREKLKQFIRDRNIALIVVDEYVSLGTPEESARAEKRRKAVAVLPTTGMGLTVDEVAKETALGKAAARTALEDAYSQGSATRSGGGRRGDPYRYCRPASAADETGASPDSLRGETASQAEKVRPEGSVDGSLTGSELDDLLNSPIEATAHS